MEDYSSVSVDTSSVADPNDFEDPVDEKIEESNEEELESFERNVPITNATVVQHETDEVSQGAEEDEPAKNPVAESEEKHDETVSNECGNSDEEKKDCKEEKLPKKVQ